ncbi:MAG: pectinesterase family protein [Lachnospiraceae bacterium]|nr:pectinesterase family protein [Lachnospiraceae bacterium]
MIDIYVNCPDNTPDFKTIADALSSVSAGFSEDASPQENYIPAEKTFPAEKSSVEPVNIHIGEGIYREKLIITRPNLTFIGSGREKTIIVYGHGAADIMPDGGKRGTFRTASVRIDTHDFTAKHLTFKNDAGYGHTAGQALALYVDGDRNAFFDCGLIGSQDTLFTAPLPIKEASPGGFKGPGEARPRVLGRHYFKDCYLQGDVDFLFGGGIVCYDNCLIYSKKPGDILPPECPDTDVLYGFITAASTPEGQPFGYVLKNCSLKSDCPPSTVYLGRPWREWAKTVYLNCYMDEHIKPVGWKDWDKNHNHFFYAEYKSYGPGANPEARADFSHQLTDEQAAEYTLEKIFQGWLPG